MEDQERLTYNVAQAARIVGVHHITLRKAIERGDLKAVRVGKRVVIPKRALEEFLAGESR